MRVGFDLNSILTRIIPGTIVLLPLSWTSEGPLVALTDISLTNSSLLIFVILALIVGEGIDLARENYKPVPNTFRRILYHETGQAEFLGLLDRWRLRLDWDIPERHSIYSSTERELYYDIVSKFDLRNDYHYVRDLYQLLLSDLNDEATRRTTKIQTDYIFAENTSIAFAIFSLLAGMRAVLGNEVETTIGLILLLAGLLGAILLLLIFDLHGRVERTYVDKLSSEYFAYRTTEDKNQ